MKSKPILFALALLLVVGAALWGVNYRLDHPPLTKADKEFRALVAGADGVNVSQQGCQKPNCGEQWTIKYKPLNAAQTRELIETLRFVDVERDVTALASAGSVVDLDLAFLKENKTLLACTLVQTQHHSVLMYIDSSTLFNPCLGSRFDKRLNRTLDAYLPQRIRP